MLQRGIQNTHYLGKEKSNSFISVEAEIAKKDLLFKKSQVVGT